MVFEARQQLERLETIDAELLEKVIIGCKLFPRHAKRSCCQIEDFVKNESGNGRLKAERALLATALADVQAMAASLTGYLMAAQEDSSSVYKVGLGSVRFLMSVGDLMIGWLLQRQAAVAVEALDAGVSDADRPFYEGKIGVAAFFAKNILPLLTSTRQVIETLDNDVMELDEAAF